MPGNDWIYLEVNRGDLYKTQYISLYAGKKGRNVQPGKKKLI